MLLHGFACGVLSMSAGVAVGVTADPFLGVLAACAVFLLGFIDARARWFR